MRVYSKAGSFFDHRDSSVKPAHQLRLGHQLTMTPQLQKAIRLLQLSAQELQAEMQLALETNPLLEINEEALSHTETAGTMSCLSNPEEEGIEAPYMSWGKPASPSQQDDDPLDEAIVNALSQDQDHNTLQQHLMWQVNLLPFTEEQRWVASYIIDAINEDGLIGEPFNTLVEAIQSTLMIDVKGIEAVLHRIQQCDPIGIAARDLQECLTLQLAQYPNETPWLSQAKNIITHHWPLLAKRDFTTLKKRMHLSAESLADVIALIQTCHPRPGTQIGQRDTRYGLPDLYATFREHRWHVTLNPLSLLPLRINPFYVQHLPTQNARDQQYIRQHLQEAQWLLNSIEQRNQTLLKVGRFLVEYQAPFLLLGEEALKPLDLTQVAQQLNMHESTVSRITMHKTMDTPRGLLELKAFFSNPMSMDHGGECSARAVRALLRKIIAAENPQNPLSDARLSQALQTHGIPVARRTIAKYRDTLCIPPAHERKHV